jgi:surface antigen
MRPLDRILATCSAAMMMAAICTGVLVTSDAAAASAQRKPTAQKVTGQKVATQKVSPQRATARQVAVRPAATKGRTVAASRVKTRSGQATAAASRRGTVTSAKLRAAGSPRYAGISCVPYARQVTGMSVAGNAHAWWHSAAGTYERGARPEQGSVLNFRSTNRMRLGHVAVVSRVIDSRTVEIDHANWAGPGGRKGMVARGVPVIDVSPGNDWSAVQVGLSGGGFGSVYPTYGFIYDRPDRGIMVANTLAKPGGTAYAAAKAPRNEVAEAWSGRVLPASTGFSTQVTFIDAPVRTVR